MEVKKVEEEKKDASPSAQPSPEAKSPNSKAEAEKKARLLQVKKARVQ